MSDLSDDFRELASAARRNSALMVALNHLAADHAPAHDLLLAAPPGERRPVLLWAAVHHLILGGADAELRSYYPTVGGTRAPDETLASCFHEFIHRFAAEIRSVLQTRVVQTNEVGRAAALVPALAWARTRRPELPIRLLEIGCSAGLNLGLDRFRIDVGPAHFGPATAAVVLRPQWRGEPPNVEDPFIAGRAGLDRAPVDLRIEVDRRWLIACTWPDDAARISTLRAAIDDALVHPPSVRQGDAVDDLHDAVEALPSDGHLVIMHSWVLAYLPPERRRQFIERCAELATIRPTTWLAMERRAEVPELPAPDTATTSGRATELVGVTFEGGAARAELLAELHPHGAWVRWEAAAISR